MAGQKGKWLHVRNSQFDHLQLRNDWFCLFAYYVSNRSVTQATYDEHFVYLNSHVAL